MERSCSNCRYGKWMTGRGFYCNALGECSKWRRRGLGQERDSDDKLAISESGDTPIGLYIVLSKDMPIDEIEIISPDGHRMRIAGIVGSR